MVIELSKYMLIRSIIAELVTYNVSAIVLEGKVETFRNVCYFDVISLGGIKKPNTCSHKMPQVYDHVLAGWSHGRVVTFSGKDVVRSGRY